MLIKPKVEVEVSHIRKNYSETLYHARSADLKKHKFSSSQLKEVAKGNRYKALQGLINPEPVNYTVKQKFLVGTLLHTYLEKGIVAEESLEGLDITHRREFNIGRESIDTFPYKDMGKIHELSIFGKWNGLDTKIRCDNYNPNLARLIDWKSIAEASVPKVKLAITKNNYLFSMAMYRRMMITAGLPVDSVDIVFYGKSYPSRVIVSVSSETLDKAEAEVSEAVDRVLALKERNFEPFNEETDKTITI